MAPLPIPAATRRFALARTGMTTTDMFLLHGPGTLHQDSPVQDAITHLDPNCIKPQAKPGARRAGQSRRGISAHSAPGMLSSIENPALEVKMSRKPDYADAELILRLYDLRREAEIRKARNWWGSGFWPENADDFMKIAMAVGTQENNWLRMVGGYWDLAASLVTHGTLNEALFLEPSFSGEMFMMYAKLHPFLKELRERLKSPTMLANVEKVVKNSKTGRERLKLMEERIAMRRKAMKEAAAKTG
jgi:hypothetical protein